MENERIEHQGYYQAPAVAIEVYACKSQGYQSLLWF